MDVSDVLYLCSWYTGKVTVYILLSHVGINQFTALWSCACFLDAQKSWRKGQNFKFSGGSKGKRQCVRSVGIWLPQSMNSVGTFDVTE